MNPFTAKPRAVDDLAAHGNMAICPVIQIQSEASEK
jgi:hypothetical protein